MQVRNKGGKNNKVVAVRWWTSFTGQSKTASMSAQATKCCTIRCLQKKSWKTSTITGGARLNRLSAHNQEILCIMQRRVSRRAFFAAAVCGHKKTQCPKGHCAIKKNRRFCTNRKMRAKASSTNLFLSFAGAFFCAGFLGGSFLGYRFFCRTSFFRAGLFRAGFLGRSFFSCRFFRRSLFSYRLFCGRFFRCYFFRRDFFYCFLSGSFFHRRFFCYCFCHNIMYLVLFVY